MTRHKLTPEARADRNKARWKIIQEVNRHKMRDRQHPYHTPVLYGMNNIQRAVHHARQFMLVSPQLLMEAGFKAKALRPMAPEKFAEVIRKLGGGK